MSKIYYHKKGNTWYFQVMIAGESHHRSSRQKTMGGARVVAEDFVLTQMLANSAKKLQGTIHDPMPPPPPVVATLRQLGERWDAAQDEDVSTGHRRNVGDHLRLHLKSLLDVPLDKISLEMILKVIPIWRRWASTSG